jgi:hypothetical protein
MTILDFALSEDCSSTGAMRSIRPCDLFKSRASASSSSLPYGTRSLSELQSLVHPLQELLAILDFDDIRARVHGFGTFRLWFLEKWL